ncbi:MAG: NAD(P)/FAD-dependent oxidoreductase [Polyangiaceae bacterium]
MKGPRNGTSFDTVVIGSGPGGLTAALALARAGQRVAVFEQHYLPGGWTHSFSLDGHQFSPGVHYVGDLGVGGGLRRVYETFGLSGDLEFTEMNPAGFDHFLIAGERFDQPRGADAWISKLIARFPDERRGITRFFEVIRGLAGDLARCDELLRFPEIALLPLRAPRLLRWGFSTLDALLDATIRDPMLRAVLSAQCGNHGLPPSRVSLPLHAAMTAHYFDGAFYPRGGAKRIAAAYVRALRRHGGEIHLDCPVKRILTEGKRAVGVELAGGVTVRAAHVVCNADPAVTFGSLLPRSLCPRQLAKVERTDYTVAMMSLFCAARMDLRAMGYDSGNYWFYRTTDVGGIYERAERELGAQVDALFLGVSSLKDPGHEARGTHTIEMFAFVPWSAFSRWSHLEMGARGPDYDAQKERLTAQMLDASEEIIPGLRERLTFVSAGTPLTNAFYCRSHRGAMYGSAKTPWQSGPFTFSARGPVDRLHFCGASILSHGVAGATMSGLAAARDVLGLEDTGSLVGPGDGTLRITHAESLREASTAAIAAE